jgi:hypothetical protein
MLRLKPASRRIIKDQVCLAQFPIKFGSPGVILLDHPGAAVVNAPDGAACPGLDAE